MNTWIVALAGLGLVLATRRKGSPIMPEDTVKPGEGEPQLALASGDPKDPEIAALLIEFDDYLSSNGAGKYTCAEEFFQMPEAPRIDGRRPVAIAPRNLWPNAIPTLRAFDDLRAQWGRPLPIRGYRPVDYNAAVGGCTAIDPPMGRGHRHQDQASRIYRERAPGFCRTRGPVYAR